MNLTLIENKIIYTQNAIRVIKRDIWYFNAKKYTLLQIKKLLFLKNSMDLTKLRVWITIGYLKKVAKQ
jgi:hypothetical protein